MGLQLLVDEDWFALHREMTGGMGFFELAVPPASLAEEPTLRAHNDFPNKLFFVALASDQKPLLEPEEGESKEFVVPVGETAGLEFVVKAKAPVKGQMDWGASLAWAVGTSRPESVESLPDGVPATDATTVTLEAVEDSHDKKGKSCGAGPVSAAPRGLVLVALSLLLLVILRPRKS